MAFICFKLLDFLGSSSGYAESTSINGVPFEGTSVDGDPLEGTRDLQTGSVVSHSDENADPFKNLRTLHENVSKPRGLDCLVSQRTEDRSSVENIKLADKLTEPSVHKNESISSRKVTNISEEKEKLLQSTHPLAENVKSADELKRGERAQIPQGHVSPQTETADETTPTSVTQTATNDTTPNSTKRQLRFQYIITKPQVHFKKRYRSKKSRLSKSKRKDDRPSYSRITQQSQRGFIRTAAGTIYGTARTVISSSARIADAIFEPVLGPLLRFFFVWFEFNLVQFLPTLEALLLIGIPLLLVLPIQIVIAVFQQIKRFWQHRKSP